MFVVFSRLDSFFTLSTQRNLYASRLFLVSLVPWIDKPWGNTLREKLHEPCACGIQIGGAKERQQCFGAEWSPEVCQAEEVCVEAVFTVSVAVGRLFVFDFFVFCTDVSSTSSVLQQP